MKMNKIWCRLGFHDYVTIKEENISTGGGWGTTIEDSICIRCAKKQLDLTNYHKRIKDYADRKIQRIKLAKQLAKKEVR